ncbi:hypothetical protein [Vibrio aestuarianus]|uniref:hypothetical protein n=1 Tax=Vibrio aestuarianus TaxID=28171 RepID=UPI0021C2C6AB|nr:hypothetical protein [Vibrio aestuarianus]MDE1211083.1 hypothetical protein [Vibrio aestuarianus]MDE1254174.1 hypothetical protein [Vibrio aestuarianus]MDE1319373.1 hypothetical protein [Vibrio aestuarianus]MDE1326499.1 hypothetical protein [Vibrio aestuarianus]CAH8242045.1 conserved hypothetical protein [Vibrio aestuarianus]
MLTTECSQNTRNTNKASAKIPYLQAQMQWFSGNPQISATQLTRVLYNFNNSDNILDAQIGRFPNLIENEKDNLNCSICNPETGDLALLFNGTDIYDGLRNKVNPAPLNCVRSTNFTSIIAPNLQRSSDPNFAYNVFYIDDSTKYINTAIVTYPHGTNNPAQWIGQSIIATNTIAAPLSLMCVNESEYWLVTLSNPSTLVAYRFGKTSDESVGAPIYLNLEPFSFITEPLNSATSSIVINQNHIAITVNGYIMCAQLRVKNNRYSNSSRILSLYNQKLVSSTATTTLMPAFDARNEQLYFLKAEDSQHKNHLWVCDIASGAIYSAHTTYVFQDDYVTLKLAPNGIIYGTNIIPPAHQDPLLVIQEIEETGEVAVSELLNEQKYSSISFGNIQYQINNL